MLRPKLQLPDSFIKNKNLLHVCALTHVHWPWPTFRDQRTIFGNQCSPSTMSPSDPTEVESLGSKRLHAWSHLTDPIRFFFFSDNIVWWHLDMLLLCTSPLPTSAQFDELSYIYTICPMESHLCPCIPFSLGPSTGSAKSSIHPSL